MSLLVHLLLLKGASDWNAAGCWRILALRWHVMLAVLMLQNETKCQHYTRDITTGASIFVGGCNYQKFLEYCNCSNIHYISLAQNKTMTIYLFIKISAKEFDMKFRQINLCFY